MSQETLSFEEIGHKPGPNRMAHGGTSEVNGVIMTGKQPTMSQQEKARRWDSLIRTLRDPGIRDLHVWHLSKMRRAVMVLLANQEELPASLTAELKSYKATLDGLHLEAIDGFADAEGIINLLPTYITESVVGELCQPDSADDE